ncbi:MAG: hypothetical protein O9332_17895 [Microcystis sp. LE19-10.1B]|nr:hypothetical protein [Microcystis sp. LE19-10.1B]MCZ8027215.1 hypothetical protein [Microcystis sp. LE19-10.1B]MCZ8361628.1 hypothetical protein [Microcystis sp. LE19-251.1A]MDJ0606471.1 hypothetical protein [Microcystis sp. M53602_WE12]
MIDSQSNFKNPVMDGFFPLPHFPLPHSPLPHFHHCLLITENAL